MLRIRIPGGAFYDEDHNRFLDVPPTNIQLEHSLLSVRRWESKWNRSWFDDPPKTEQERIDYIRCMTITPNVDPNVFRVIPKDILSQIEAYKNSPMTATTFGKDNGQRKPKQKFLTAEIVYWWMTEYNIPFECEKWHLNQLLTLIRVCSEKKNPPKKMTAREARDHHRAVNAQRRARKG